MADMLRLDLLAELMLSGAAFGRAAVHAEQGGGDA
jgi:hypothetical protein